MDWDVFLSVLAALVVFDVMKGLPGFCRGFISGFRKARK